MNHRPLARRHAREHTYIRTRTFATFRDGLVDAESHTRNRRQCLVAIGKDKNCRSKYCNEVPLGRRLLTRGGLHSLTLFRRYFNSHKAVMCRKKDHVLKTDTTSPSGECPLYTLYTNKRMGPETLPHYKCYGPRYLQTYISEKMRSKLPHASPYPTQCLPAAFQVAPTVIVRTLTPVKESNQPYRVYQCKSFCFPRPNYHGSSVSFSPIFGLN